jgi:hypothetical protein
MAKKKTVRRGGGKPGVRQRRKRPGEKITVACPVPVETADKLTAMAEQMGMSRSGFLEKVFDQLIKCDESAMRDPWDGLLFGPIGEMLEHAVTKALETAARENSVAGVLRKSAEMKRALAREQRKSKRKEVKL